MRDSHSWWAGRKVQTDDGEQGIILDRVRALRRLSRRQLARMILEKDYLLRPEKVSGLSSGRGI